MELALTLVIFVIIDLVCTVWLLARQREINRRLTSLEADKLVKSVSDSSGENLEQVASLLSALGGKRD